MSRVEDRGMKLLKNRFLYGREHRTVLLVTLNEGRIARFVAADDRDYDPIRKMAQAAAAVALQPA